MGRKAGAAEGDEMGIRRAFWLSKGLDILVERTRKSMGLSRSAFYRYTLVKVLQELSVLSMSAHAAIAEARVATPIQGLKDMETSE